MRDLPPDVSKSTPSSDLEKKPAIDPDFKHTLNNRPAKKETYWKRGLLERVIVQNSSLNLFKDPLLENDSRPDNLFRVLERSLSVDTSMLVLSFFWCSMILLTLLILLKGLWFYESMLNMILVPSTFALFILLFSDRGDGPRIVRDLETLLNDPLFLAQLYLESSLFFSGIAILLHKTLPENGGMILRETEFMGHMKIEKGPLRKRLVNTMVIIFQLAVITLVSVIVSNVLLLPLYTVQISFPVFFAFLLLVALLILSIFYIRAYLKVSKTQTENADIISSTAFLGFRILKNSTFIISVLCIVIAFIGLIVAISVFNVQILQEFQLLKTPGAL